MKSIINIGGKRVIPKDLLIELTLYGFQNAVMIRANLASSQ